jgi:hypothetical protein
MSHTFGDEALVDMKHYTIVFSYLFEGLAQMHVLIIAHEL